MSSSTESWRCSPVRTPASSLSSSAIRSGLSDAEIAGLVDRGILAGTGSPSSQLTGRVRELANQWGHSLVEIGELVQQTAGVISAAAVAAGQSGHRVVSVDLEELRSKSYLSTYFAGQS